MEKPSLGDQACDRITGFEGIVTGISGYLNGCARVMIQPSTLDKEGKMLEPQWFDIEQTKLVQRDPLGFSGKQQPVGGPRPDAARTPDAPR